MRYSSTARRAGRRPSSGSRPASIRTHDGGPLRILFGSCRTAAPHEPPWTLEFDHDDRARGVDAVWAHGLRMLEQPPDEWPHLLLFIGDQVYADDSSPQTRAKVARRRGHLADDDRYPPLDDVADFEEYTWLYHEAWLPEVERWMFSVVPSAMIFDDHDMIDDWNTSSSWLDDIRQQPWWKDRAVGGFMSYWVYQHLGNLSPREIRAEGMLDTFVELGDATAALTAWAEEAERDAGVPGGYRFSFYRDLGPVRLVVIDSRTGRVLEPGGRAMVDAEEWAWVVEHADVECEHLVLATSVPVNMPGGLHDLEQWNERMCNGAWGRPFARLGERIRRAVDLEDWSAFHDSYRALMDLVRDVATPREQPAPDPPATVTILSGDVHFSFRSRAMLRRRARSSGAGEPGPPDRELADPQRAPDARAAGDQGRAVTLRRVRRPRAAPVGRRTPGHDEMGCRGRAVLRQSHLRRRAERAGCPDGARAGGAGRRRPPRAHRGGDARRCRARSAGSPRRCIRPPNTSAVRRNQPQPTITPATTSVSQWTPSRARDVATATVTIAATAAAAARPRRGHVAADDERQREPCRGRRRGVPRRERRTGGVDEVRYVRPVTIDDQLEPIVDRRHADEDDEQEQDDVQVAVPDVVVDRDRDADDDEVGGAAEIGERVERRRRPRRGVLAPPLGDGRVPLGPARCPDPPCRTRSRRRARSRTRSPARSPASTRRPPVDRSPGPAHQAGDAAAASRPATAPRPRDQPDQVRPANGTAPRPHRPRPAPRRERPASRARSDALRQRAPMSRWRGAEITQNRP